jgi:hypothetical protein
VIEKLKDIFNEIYLLIYSEEYVFANKKIEKQLANFVKKMPPTADENWIREFAIFQFAHYARMKKRVDRVYVNWIFGAKSLKRYADRTEQQSYFANKFKIDIGLRSKLEPLSAIEFMDKEKSRFDDDAERFVHCDHLALFDDRSSICRNCVFYVTCKKHEL